MDAVFALLPVSVIKIAWPFFRILAALSIAPIVGDAIVPVRARIAASFLLAAAVLPALADAPAIDPLSAQGIALVFEQILIGALFGLVFHLVLGAFMTGGFLIASQLGFAMAVMNDPQNGTSSDVVTQFLYLLFVMLFLSMDGHLLVVQVVFTSFKAWPVGNGLNVASLRDFAYMIGWMLSAALLLALPTVFATMVVQVGMGLLGRAVAQLNVYSLGFSVTMIVGLLVVSHLVFAVPGHYAHMTERALDFLAREMGAAAGVTGGAHG
ncbi:flagellar biosynthetic protein FliR [Trinickia mobilis]|uniref:flagellar biosynthetic protein FliR n=1 Tax=Trinickia mobilis TaxID=2816356 RepID=UPI001A8F3672|nr:flagellar biosynthetic protein FliR [Trinickia mobilis]